MDETLQPNSGRSTEFLISEYQALRDEIIKRMELIHQLTSLTLIAAGTLFPVSLQTGSATISLIYPSLAMFLAAALRHNTTRMGQLGAYIRENIEGHFLGEGKGWETTRTHLGLAKFSSRGIFAGTQVLAMFLGVSQTDFPLEDVVLLIVSFLCTIYTLYLFRGRRPQTK